MQAIILNFMMNTFTLLICALVKEVISQTKDISPAKILAQQKTVSENDDLYLTCSTFGIKKDSMVNVFLLKNGHGFKKMTQKQDQNDVTFKISKVRLDHSGNYSCVYSPPNYTLPAVAERGDNIIQILVIANSLPADISVVGRLTVYEGDHVEFKCTLSDTLHTLNECQLIYSYLWKNENILQVTAFDVARMEASFTIEDAVLRDSGHYSCTVLPSECIQEHENKFYGKNAVFLEVHKDVLEEREDVEERDDVEEREDVEEQENVESQSEEEDSFSIEDAEGYQNIPTAENDSLYNNCEGAYSLPAESNMTSSPPLKVLKPVGMGLPLDG
ncbi:uncharacterized protein [Leuresthes tenuis]|uniref:uncharacterized protein n=1 Tax=Leuresthes tenuis TaxID=355514 RepID=UPI003B507421